MNINKILAKEGLILLGVSAVLYFLITPLYRNIPIVFPVCRVQFANNSSYTIPIYPDIDYGKISDIRIFLKQIHNPPQKLIAKRIEEFSRGTKINSPVKDVHCVNKWQVGLSEFSSAILSHNLLIKVLFVYSLLALIRFIFWSIKTLRRET